MTYSARASEFGREHIYIVEIDLEYCSLTHGTSPCTATETGDNKCYNTRPSCNDLANYDDNIATPTIKTYRFCSSTSPQPIGLDAIPSVKSVSMSASRIDIKGGLGERSSVSISFMDHPSSDFGIDSYISDRTYIAMERGTFWTKLRARNENYQYRAVRVMSGFLVNGAYDSNNFKIRSYVIQSLDAANGRATLKGQDPLKLAMSNKAQVPAPNTGTTTGVLTVGATTITMNTDEALDYETSGKVLIGNEVIAYSGRTASTLTGCTRAQNNTTAKEHSSGATVQQCYEQTGVNVDVIVADILENYANIPASYIDSSAWAAESALYLEENMNGIIVKPMDVSKVLIELAESAPHYLYWDEEDDRIVFSALKAPPPSATQLVEGNILENSFSVRDLPDMRTSTIYVNCGQIDPTKNLDEETNYELSYVRVDTDSIIAYKSNQVRKINSRWIGVSGLGAAQKIATLYGRRFSSIPREVSFKTDPRYRIASDGSSGLNQLRVINHRDIAGFDGGSIDTMFQILSEQENTSNYKYNGIEFRYGDELPDDSVEGITTVYIPPNQVDGNLADLYTSQIGTITGDIVVVFIVNNGNTVSASDTSTPALTTGDWSGATSVDLTLQVNTGGVICGRGGDGGLGVFVGSGSNGGLALDVTEDITLINNGIIGGGGGGGGGAEDNYSYTGGGGGAGFGEKGDVTTYIGGTPTGSGTNPDDGTNTDGGDGGVTSYTFGGSSYSVDGGNGGGLGQNGTTGIGFGGFPTVDLGSGGVAGDAIDLNGNTITYTVTGTILGSIVA